MVNIKNIELVRSFYQAIEDNNYETVAALCHEQFTFYSQLDRPLDINGFLAQEKGNMDGYPGFTFRIHDIFSHDDKVACYMIFEGVHSAMMHDIQPTGKKVRFSLMMLLTIKDDKIFEKRAHFNEADIMKQLQD
ncbi:ester cyclase [Pseudoalteromonas shioyasakiensis]|uniref:ester cyclase n=1 Tax=Pseudoalteromonas shioyasakiensis TaxID=1190813 RepID=UPI00255209F8|nr:ester cyclase [Pseudoalteromonas shioyasakiensis]MDK9683412.1 ester cyclase [Pseudoalteromonas shioyasakiensis]